jgi:hypothetical protein
LEACERFKAQGDKSETGKAEMQLRRALRVVTCLPRGRGREAARQGITKLTASPPLGVDSRRYGILTQVPSPLFVIVEGTPSPSAL